MGIKITSAAGGGTIGDGRIPLTSANSAIGPLTVSPTTTEIKVGATPIPNRKQIYIVNDASVPVFINFSNPIVLANDDYIVGFSGEAILIDVDPDNPEPMYIRTEEITTTIRIFEIG